MKNIHKYTHRDQQAMSPMQMSYRYEQDSPMIQNLMYPITPKRRPNLRRQEQYNSPSMFIQSSLHNGPFSNNHNGKMSSMRMNKNTTKQTKINQVTAFDESMNDYQQMVQEYSFKRQSRSTAVKSPAFTAINQMFESDREPEQCLSKTDNDALYVKLCTIQQQMMQLNTSINDLDEQFQQIKINELGFLKHKDNIPNKQIPKHSRFGGKVDVKMEVKLEESDVEQEVQLRIFNPEAISNTDDVLIFGKPEEKENKLVFMQQTICDMVGRLSQLLNNQHQVKQQFGSKYQPMQDNHDSSVFTFNKSLNKFTRIYKCKFCEQKFTQACSLGGHISRVHKLESQQLKVSTPIIKKHSIHKQRKQVLLKSIRQSLRE